MSNFKDFFREVITSGKWACLTDPISDHNDIPTSFMFESLCSKENLIKSITKMTLEDIYILPTVIIQEIMNYFPIIPNDKEQQIFCETFEVSRKMKPSMKKMIFYLLRLVKGSEDLMLQDLTLSTMIPSWLQFRFSSNIYNGVCTHVYRKGPKVWHSLELLFWIKEENKKLQAYFKSTNNDDVLLTVEKKATHFELSDATEKFTHFIDLINAVSHKCLKNLLRNRIII